MKTNITFTLIKIQKAKIILVIIVCVAKKKLQKENKISIGLWYIVYIGTWNLPILYFCISVLYIITDFSTGHWKGINASLDVIANWSL